MLSSMMDDNNNSEIDIDNIISNNETEKIDDFMSD